MNCVPVVALFGQDMNVDVLPSSVAGFRVDVDADDAAVDGQAPDAVPEVAFGVAPKVPLPLAELKSDVGNPAAPSAYLFVCVSQEDCPTFPGNEPAFSAVDPTGVTGVAPPVDHGVVRGGAQTGFCAASPAWTVAEEAPLVPG
jgi:hypothetical protein